MIISATTIEEKTFLLLNVDILPEKGDYIVETGQIYKVLYKVIYNDKHVYIVKVVNESDM